MDYKVNWSPEAIEDLQSVADYIAKDSRVYAQSVIAKVFEVSKSLASHPLIGRIVPEIGTTELRERFIYSYRLIYQIGGNKILIVAVIHGKRLIMSWTV
ncbi:type II toxin-antitoxin system RelE/ParE family toxin [Candidatus Methylobacter oryzae]|uniref:Type II toxin-antitoxin system RelE/ParE family toxin n=1 Tax=Candidatus Methylobacter oryzae TaxID=2497749 RepID=A0ABY3CAF3_9GAMM|nr:type II toxin-antitoxin system RelE/ParE family toxin [Candidatus Methylobacter oryzae]TRW95141.1 type II toxin-antitoxin system RelE/ParE family toxin [Candidatus Methylobacter oryzae]